MAYLLLIHEPVGQREARGEAEGRAVYQRMLDFGETLKARGVLRAAESLAPAGPGQRLQVREGQARVVDGPYAEAKEMLGGFFLLDVATREEALAIAARCPAAQWATVEVRATAPCFETTVR